MGWGVYVKHVLVRPLLEAPRTSRGGGVRRWAGHIEIANLMIDRGCEEWNHGLYKACRGGNVALVNLMILKGAAD